MTGVDILILAVVHPVMTAGIGAGSEAAILDCFVGQDERLAADVLAQDRQKRGFRSSTTMMRARLVSRSTRVSIFILCKPPRAFGAFVTPGSLPINVSSTSTAPPLPPKGRAYGASGTKRSCR